MADFFYFTRQKFRSQAFGALLNRMQKFLMQNCIYNYFPVGGNRGVRASRLPYHCIPPPALSDVSPTFLNKKTKKSTLTVTLAVSGRAVRFVGL